MRTIRVLAEPARDDTARLCQAAELDGVMARWFDTQRCSAAIVRPDHYVFAVAADERELAADLRELQARLR
jgi:3-(3-hydroxy-phenyl)propionate hydroxylase